MTSYYRRGSAGGFLLNCETSFEIVIYARNCSRDRCCANLMDTYVLRDFGFPEEFSTENLIGRMIEYQVLQ